MIGLFDSGVGGLFAARVVRRLLPQADIAYFADEANLPYGEKDNATLLALSHAALDRLRALGAEAVLAACGTVGSTVLPALTQTVSLPLCGILPATATLTADVWRARGGGILVLGTRATVRAGRLLAEIRARAPGAPCRALACPDFVPLSEALLQGNAPAGLLWQAASAADAVTRALSPVSDFPARVVVLGCTHFSALAPFVKQAIPRAALVDAAEAGATAWVASLPASLRTGQGHTWYVSSKGNSPLSHIGQRLGVGAPINDPPV